MLVMNEAFDTWPLKKGDADSDDYHGYFYEWWR